mmetsp:Transcript_25114/g.63685  ORF Transcript_25114/g.63685 Transcript_25114/m.63685 type:complete len:368 (-) Transcript_25114:544-1647(-)
MTMQFAFVGLALLWVGLASAANDVGEERLIGWKGEVKPIEYGLGEPTPTNETKKPWVQTISWRPRAFVYHNFLSDAECAHIIKLAAPQMKRSTVVGSHNEGVVDDIRTSAGTFLQRNQDAVISAIEQRLAVWTQLPPSHQEDMQVLRYGPTNKYGAHLDGLERVATVLMYLVPPEEGGETAFPVSGEWIDPAMGEPTQGAFSDCAKGHVAYKPKRGDALMFYDVTPSYREADSNSQHTGCPVVKGVKWNAVKWIHGIPFRENEYNESLAQPYTPLPDPGVCADLHERCDAWAKGGECEKNAGYMLGSGSGQGMCRLSCKACKPCPEGDRACIVANRKAGGYMNFDDAELRLAEIGVPPGTVSEAMGH